MKVEYKINPEMFFYENIFPEMVTAFFQEKVSGKINGGKVDFYFNDDILNIAYIDGNGFIIAQKKYFQERGKNEKGKLTI